MYLSMPQRLRSVRAVLRKECVRQETQSNQQQVLVQGMRIAMMADGVSFREGSPHQLGMGCRVPPKQKECGAHTFAFKSIQYFRRSPRPGSVIESQHKLFRAERQANCLRPTRGVLLESTSSTRSVPSACGFPGHPAATATNGVTAVAIARRTMRVMIDPGRQLTATDDCRQACREREASALRFAPA